ncbi:MAG: metal-dependent transcriptional regulator [Bacteroidia bacterium]|nr:metal-dependent transcriptional regulator [Sphingobacteriaceae bacterium]MBK7310837.1 metal-dependent transcriptional regulator [Sphingobacteriaceae bacterium]MBK7817401.1 metal-dependent transcriptional regulator [Sphingobacteriaceae bacterium]MBP9069489.1 metal-dependent transcriptional regulator [Bacteroidia bacterium]
MRQETVENYLKTIYNLSSNNSTVVVNQQLANKLEISPASVTEGLRKLHELKYVVYEKSYGTRLTSAGAKLALSIVRRHRIWETYLAKELGFGWDEVHEIAEELEHIKNDKLINKLSAILGNPMFDPHGDPIPDAKGKIKKSNFIKLSEAKVKGNYSLMGVTDHSAAFLKYLEKHQLIIGANIDIKGIEEFDNTIVLICNKKEVTISAKAAECIIVETV